MPYAPARPCVNPKCGVLGCEKHGAKRRHYEQHPRGSSTAQGYGSAWRRLRLQILARDPICRDDSGCSAPSVDVDHIKARKLFANSADADLASNLRGMCRRHHSRKTALVDGRWGNR